MLSILVSSLDEKEPAGLRSSRQFGEQHGRDLGSADGFATSQFVVFTLQANVSETVSK